MKRYPRAIRTFSVRQSRRRSNQFSLFTRGADTDAPPGCTPDCARKETKDCNQCIFNRHYRVGYETTSQKGAILGKDNS
jgi:hypothetical protein